MISSTKHSLTFLPLSALWIFVGLSHGVDVNEIQEISMSSSKGSSVASMPCMKKLLPCQEYSKLTVTPPPPSCCVPLKEMVSDDPKCFCDVFDSVDMLKNLNITQDDALRLPKACGAIAIISVCREDAAPPTSSPATPGGSSTASENSTSTKSGANVISYLAGCGLTAGFLSLIFVSSF